MDDPYIDEDGEPLMDPDARDPSPEPQPYDDLEDDLGGGDWTRDRSPTPVHGDDGGAGSSSRPRKRLLKKGGGGDGMPGDDGLEDWLEDADAGAGAESAPSKKGKGSSALRDLARGGGNERKEKKRRREDDGRERDRGMVREKRGSGGKSSGGGGGHQDEDGEREIQELWDTIAGGDSEVPAKHVCLPNVVKLLLSYSCSLFWLGNTLPLYDDFSTLLPRETEVFGVQPPPLRF